MTINATYMKLLRLGIVPNMARGAHRDSQTMFVVHKEKDTEYAIDDLGYFEDTGDSEAIIESIKNLEFVLDRHHDVIVAIKNEFEKRLKRSVWVTANAGMQVSVSFGDFNGAFADLMLSFRTPEDLKECATSIYDMGVTDSSKKEIIEQLKMFLMVILDPDYKQYTTNMNYDNLIIKSLDDDGFGFHTDEDDDDDE